MSAGEASRGSWYNDDESPGARWSANSHLEAETGLRYDRSGQPYGTTPTPEIVDGFVSPDITVTVDDEMDASPGRVTVEVHVPSMPWSVEQEMDELLARCREAEAQSSIGPWSQANTASVSSTARRPDMVYFLTIQEQRVALAPPPSPRSPSEPRPRRPRPRRPQRPGYVLNFHCSRQEARIEEEVSQQMSCVEGASPRSEVDEQPKNWAPPHFLERLRPEACSWSPLRSRTSSPKMTPAGTTSTWMGSDPPGTASSATNSEAVPQLEALETLDASSPDSPKNRSNRGNRSFLEPPAAQIWRRRASNKPRQVLIFPMKEQRIRKNMSPVARPKGKVLWLPPLRQVPAPHVSVLPLERRNRGAPVATGSLELGEEQSAAGEAGDSSYSCGLGSGASCGSPVPQKTLK